MHNSVCTAYCTLNIIGEGCGTVTRFLHDFGRFGVWFGVIRAINYNYYPLRASRANVNRF